MAKVTPGRVTRASGVAGALPLQPRHSAVSNAQIRIGNGPWIRVERVEIITDHSSALMEFDPHARPLAGTYRRVTHAMRELLILAIERCDLDANSEEEMLAYLEAFTTMSNDELKNLMDEWSQLPRMCGHPLWLESVTLDRLRTEIEQRLGVPF